MFLHDSNDSDKSKYQDVMRSDLEMSDGVELNLLEHDFSHTFQMKLMVVETSRGIQHRAHGLIR